MVYTSHTWNNEVITDAKLNAIEQGVRAGTLLSGTDIDTDKDWNGKSITNLNLLAAGSVMTTILTWIPDRSLTRLRYTDDAGVWTTGAGQWATLKTTPPARAGIEGVATVSFALQGQIDGGASARILKNGVILPGTYTVGANGIATIIADVPVESGDVLAVQAAPGAWSASVSQFRISAFAIPALGESRPW